MSQDRSDAAAKNAREPARRNPVALFGRPLAADELRSHLRTMIGDVTRLTTLEVIEAAQRSADSQTPQSVRSPARV